jgi:hypothetical protein
MIGTNDGQGALLSQTHVEQALLPALDDLARANLEDEGLVALERAVKDLAVHQRARVLGQMRFAPAADESVHTCMARRSPF